MSALRESLLFYKGIRNLKLRNWHSGPDEWVEAMIKLDCGPREKYVVPQLVEQLCQLISNLAARANTIDPWARSEIVDHVRLLLRQLEERV